MILTRRAALNGVWLDELDPRIVITGIEPAEGKENITAVDTASGFGQRITVKRRQSIDLVIRFMMQEHGKTVEGMQARSELLERVIAWASAGGYLTLNYKADRRLYVILAQAPGEGSLREFTREYAITFRAYGVPYWEQESAKSMSVNRWNSGASMTLPIEGSAETQVNIELNNISGATISTVTLNVGGQVMNFTDLGLNGGETLVVDHTADGYVRIRIRSGGSYRSAMARRTDGSANDFLVRPGNVYCGFSAQRACSMTAVWRARYL